MSSQFKNTVAYLVGDILLKIGYVALLPYYSARCSAHEYGILGAGSLVGAIASAISGLSMGAVTLKLSNQSTGDKSSTIKHIQLVNVLWTFFVCGIILLVGFGLISWSSFKYESAVWMISGLAGALGGCTTVICTKLQIDGSAIAYRATGLVSFFSATIVSVALIAAFRLQAIAIVLGQVFGAVVALVLACRLTRFTWVMQVQKSEVFKYLPISVPLTIYLIGAILTDQLAKAFIGASLSMDELGVYTIATQYAMLVSAALLAFNTAWLPEFFRLGSDQSTAPKIRRIRSIFFGMGVLLTVLAVGVSPLLFHLFISPRYLAALRYLPVLCATSALWATLWSPIMNHLVLLGKERYIPLITVGTTILVIGMNSVLTSSFGVLGATIGNGCAAVIAVLVGIRKIESCEHVTFLDTKIFHYFSWGVSYVAFATVRRNWLADSLMLDICDAVFGVVSALVVGMLLKKNFKYAV